MIFRDLEFTRSPTKFMLLCFVCALFLLNLNAAETVVYSNGFENNDGGYSHTGTLDAWEWGTPSPTFTDGPGAAHSGSNCWGTDLDDAVQFGSVSNLVSPAIELPALGANQIMRVRFFGWIAVDLMEDRGQFQVSSDGISWETKADLLLVMEGGWNEYVFDISDYAGSTIYLRFRCFVDNSDTFDPPDIEYNMAGLYVDDVAITISDAPSIKSILTFEGSENQSSLASCPWIYVKGKNGDFIKENDIYSTARGAGMEYTDFYSLNSKLIANTQGKYEIKLKETEQEESFTDLLNLIVVDVASGKIAGDEDGNVFTYENEKNTERPLSAISKKGDDVLSLLSEADEIGYKAYDKDTIVLDFESIEDVPHPIFLLRAQGFLTDTVPGSLTFNQPKIQIQTQDISGDWKTRNVFYPRWKFATAGYDMAGLFPFSKKVRLHVLSCRTGKYHLIDWAVISTKPQEPVTITNLRPVSAIRSDGIDVTEALSTANGEYVHMSTNEEIKILFDEPPAIEENERYFIIKSKGYYIPSGTYFFFTWDGSKWAQRDGWTISEAGDQTRKFDLSLWLPDPDGEYKVRIWQDFFFDPAAIDYVGLTRDNNDLTMSYAKDLRNDNSILNLLNVSDNQRHLWDWGEAYPFRDRWVEIHWTEDNINTPPSTNPVNVLNTNLPTPTIDWTYFDLDGDIQNQYEIEVWSGPGGTGTNLWDPPVGQGEAFSEMYTGVSLVSGQDYYARVKAFDGTSWGVWSEKIFTMGSNLPPVAEAGPDIIVTAAPSCLTSVVLDGSASYDPDGDILSFLWIGPFGTEIGPKPGVFLPSGTFLIKLIVSDDNGGYSKDSVMITINDVDPPIPDSVSLPPIIEECSVVIADRPTAHDSCTGMVVGTTDSLIFETPGTRVIVWSYDDGNGNISTQTQTVTVTDDIPPVPDEPTLQQISGVCSVSISTKPTATDNCTGTIVGKTTDPLVYDKQGMYTITWQYIDNAGNISTQIQTVTVTDNTAPVPDMATLPTLSKACEIIVTQIPTATDGCAGEIMGTTEDSLIYSKAGTYTITWKYDDGKGNISTQPQTVIVEDNMPPVPDLASLPEVRGDCKVNMICQRPTATDECEGIIIGSTSDPLEYRKQGVYTITWTYDDGNGNISTQLQTVIVDDITPPVPKIDPLPTLQGNCSVNVINKPIATDNCTGKIVGKTSDPLCYTKQGTYTIKWKYTDGNGNTTTQPQTVIVKDNVAPEPDVHQLPTIQGDCKVYICVKPTATDNCKGKIIGKTYNRLYYTKQGTYTIKWRYKDGNGNTSTQMQTVIVHDNSAPVPKVASLPDIYGRLSSYRTFRRCTNCCTKKFKVKYFPSALDNCSGKIVATTSSPLIFYKKGDFTIVWKYDDGNGNVTTQNQTVHVR